MNYRQSSIQNALTVDVEDYYHAEIFSGIVKRDDWSKLPRRVEGNTEKLLRLFRTHNVCGTFFILGIVAEEFPGLVRRINDAGHEIASHGYDHRMVTKMTPEEFREDVRRSKRILESITGDKIAGYRAPTFSISEGTSWTYEILREEGFIYSSSVYPIYHDRYGWPGFGSEPRIMSKNGVAGIWEIPMTAYITRVGAIPFGGGGYLRLFPLKWTEWGIRMRNDREHLPAIVYVHPWELDPQQPRLSRSKISMFRHYVNLAKTEEKLDRMFSRLRFASLNQVFQSTIR